MAGTCNASKYNTCHYDNDGCGAVAAAITGCPRWWRRGHLHCAIRDVIYDDGCGAVAAAITGCPRWWRRGNLYCMCVYICMYVCNYLHCTL